MHGDIDFTVYRTPVELTSTAYFEIGPGRYNGKHWQPGFAFLSEDAFDIAEPIFVRHDPQFDHYGMNDIERSVGMAIAADLRTGAFAASAYRDAPEVRAMLNSLADVMETAYSASDYACVLGL